MAMTARALVPGMLCLLVPILVLAQAVDLDKRLLQLAERGDISGVLSLLKAKANPNFADERGITPLINAAWRGDSVMARVLLDAGARVDQPGRAGCTPLIWAARNGWTETVGLLLDKGAKIDHQDSGGLTALIRAVWNGKEDTVLVLVSRGANVFLEDRFGNNALTYAVAQGELVIARIMAGRRDIDDLLQFRESIEEKIDRIPFTACGEAPVREGEFGGMKRLGPMAPPRQ